jgi:hypothetical protein
MLTTIIIIILPVKRGEEDNFKAVYSHIYIYISVYKNLNMHMLMIIITISLTVKRGEEEDCRAR